MQDLTTGPLTRHLLKTTSFVLVTGLADRVKATFRDASLMAAGVMLLFALASDIALIAIPAIPLSRLPGFELHTVWYLSGGAVFVQLALSMFLPRREFNRRLTFAIPHARAA